MTTFVALSEREHAVAFNVAAESSSREMLVPCRALIEEAVRDGWSLETFRRKAEEALA